MTTRSFSHAKASYSKPSLSCLAFSVIYVHADAVRTYMHIFISRILHKIITSHCKPSFRCLYCRIIIYICPDAVRINIKIILRSRFTRIEASYRKTSLGCFGCPIININPYPFIVYCKYRLPDPVLHFKQSLFHVCRRSCDPKLRYRSFNILCYHRIRH